MTGKDHDQGCRKHSPDKSHANHPLRENLRLARQLLGGTLPSRVVKSLETLSKDFNFSLGKGELQLIDGCCYVTHTGLLRLARRRKCNGIHVEAVDSLCDSTAGRFVLKATVFPSKSSCGFVGYGDADPSNVSPIVRGAEMRVAETRAVNRALRKAYGIGLCSVEEIGSFAAPSELARVSEKLPPQVCKWERLWRSQGPRPPLPDHSPAPARCQLGEVLRHRFLRGEESA